MRRSVFIFQMLIVLSLSVVSASNSYAATFTVNDIGDAADAAAGNGICETAAGNGVCTLRAAAQETDALAGDDIIQFSSLFSTAQTISIAGQITLSTNVTVVGTGANILTIRNTATAGVTSRVFSINSLNDNVSLSGMTITGGTSFSGGGIYNNGNLTMTNCTVTGNTVSASGGGGGVFSTGNLMVTNSVIIGNTASGSGGGIFSGRNSTVMNSVVSGNTAGGLGGGGIRQSGGTVNVVNSTISNNTSTQVDTGGGIDSSFGVLVVTNSTIFGNIVTSISNTNGGGIWISSTATITNSTITNNRAGGTASASGIFRQSGGTRPATVRNSIIAGNQNNSAQPDVVGPFTTTGGGFNLIGNVGSSTGFNQTGDQTGTAGSPLNPMLGPLANNGGPTQTCALLVGSSAIDAADPANFLISDQRGVSRPRDSDGNGSIRADIGAFERDGTPLNRTPFDFDGDFKTDVSIFRPSSGQWWLLKSSTNQAVVAQFGNSSDEITPSDFTGDNKADVALWRPSTGEWFVLRSEDNTYYGFPFGTSGDIPLVGDFDADGRADVCIYRPSNSVWYIQKSSGSISVISFGEVGDVPVVGDYDGDGKSDIATFRPSNGQWWRLRSTAGLAVTTFGVGTDKAVQGDYTGDGKTDIAVWRPSTGEWFVLKSEDGSYFSFPFGTTGDIPSPGDYDGDGMFDATVFRPSASTWFIQRTTAGTQIVQFGLSSDQPVPSAFVP